MESKRKTIYLGSLFLLLTHGFWMCSAKPRSQQEPLVEGMSSNSDDPNEIQTNMEKSGNMVQSSPVTSKSFYLGMLKTALQEHHIKELIAKTPQSCSLLADKTSFRIPHVVPLAEQLQDLALLLVYVANDCDILALEILEELEATLDEPGDVSKILQEFIKNLNLEDTPRERILKRDTEESSTDMHNETMVHMKAIVSQIRFMKGLTKSKTNKLEAGRKCKWSWKTVDECDYSTEENGDNITYQSLSKAMDGCEAIEDCSGILEKDSYVLVRSCSVSNSKRSHQLFWGKNCLRKKRHVLVRSKRESCNQHEAEKDISTFMDQIPVVRAWYNAGTAVYYSTQDNCDELAKERAIKSVGEFIGDFTPIKVKG